MFHNVVIGKLLVPEYQLFASSQQDWEQNEKNDTLYTNTRFLPAVMKEAGIVPSVSEVRRNKPELAVTLDHPDFLTVKWGKHFLFVAVGN